MAAGAGDDAARASLARRLGVAPGRLAGLPPDIVALIERRLVELSEAAATDELTGALRRRAGLEALEREARRAHRHGDRRLVVAFADVQALKLFNDRRGHDAGDALLRELAAAFRRRLRAYDLVLRWGGDEFVCALGGAGLENAERILTQVESDFAGRTGARFRFGLADLAPGDDAAALVARADADLYVRRRRAGAGSGRERDGEPSRPSRQGLSLHSPA